MGCQNFQNKNFLTKRGYFTRRQNLHKNFLKKRGYFTGRQSFGDNLLMKKILLENYIRKTMGSPRSCWLEETASVVGVHQQSVLFFHELHPGLVGRLQPTVITVGESVGRECRQSALRPDGRGSLLDRREVLRLEVPLRRGYGGAGCGLSQTLGTFIHERNEVPCR